VKIIIEITKCDVFGTQCRVDQLVPHTAATLSLVCGNDPLFVANIHKCIQKIVFITFEKKSQIISIIFLYLTTSNNK